MEEKKKNIVLITTWFAPANGVAVNRMVSFAKYLDHTQFDLTVLTLDHKGESINERLYNCDVLRFSNDGFLKLPVFNVSDGKFKHKLKVAWKIFLLKFKKDIYSSWRKKVLSHLITMHTQKKIDLLISSFSPEAAHLVALDFCKKNKEVKWIADMRDEMSQNPTIDSATVSKYKQIESEINLHAHAVTTVSAPLVELFRKSTMTQVKLIEEIRNGFDHEMTPTPQPFNSTFTITYCGTFYGVHKPTLFLNALEALISENEMPHQWKLRFVGTPRNFQVPTLMKKHVVFVEKVDQIKSLEYMCSSDANLFMVANTSRVGVYTGKLFDYLSVQRPVLAILNKSDVAADLIRESGLGYIASNENETEIKEQIKLLIQDWKSRISAPVNLKCIEQLHRKFQVQKLNSLITKLIHES